MKIPIPFNARAFRPPIDARQLRESPRVKDIRLHELPNRAVLREGQTS